MKLNPNEVSKTRSRARINAILKDAGIIPTPMPKKQLYISNHTKLTSGLFVLGAISITALYIGIPLFSAMHQLLYPVLQDVVIVSIFLAEVTIYMVATISKTNGDSHRG